MRRVVHSVLMAAAVMASGTTYSIAATLTWTGAGNGHLTDPANWVGGVAPTASDRLSFPPDLSLSTVLMDGDMTFQGIDIINQSAWSISGGVLTLTSATPLTMTNFGALTLPGNVRLTAASPTISVTAIVAGGGRLVFGPSGSLAVSGGTVHVQAANSEIDFLGTINETAPTSFQVSGNVIAFGADNHFTGPLESTAATLAARSTFPFGNASVTIDQGQLVFHANPLGGPGPISISHVARLSLLAPSNSGGNLVTFDGPVFMESTILGGTQVIQANHDVYFVGAISGSGSLEVASGAGTVVLSNPANSFTGHLAANGPDAKLYVEESGAAGAISQLSVSQGLINIYDFQHVPDFVCAGGLGVNLGGDGKFSVTQHLDVASCRLTLTMLALPTPGTTYTIIENLTGSAFPGPLPGWPSGYTLPINGMPMTVTYQAGASGHDFALVTAPAPVTPTTRLREMWWSGPSENGWGMSLVQHNDTLVAAMYVYDANGKPTWLFMPGGAWDSTHTIYTGSVYTPSGTPFFAYDTTHWVAGSAKGNVTITFQDTNNAILDYTIGGISGRKVITREIFANGGAAAPDRSDLWWGGIAQNGWGITVIQQASTLFPLWFTYDANGVATWYSMPGGTWTTSDTYEGRVYRTTGSPWVGRDYDATKLQVFDVGPYKIQFTGDAASFTYAIDGHTGTIPLVREPF